MELPLDQTTAESTETSTETNTTSTLNESKSLTELINQLPITEEQVSSLNKKDIAPLFKSIQDIFSEYEPRMQKYAQIERELQLQRAKEQEKKEEEYMKRMNLVAELVSQNENGADSAQILKDFFGKLKNSGNLEEPIKVMDAIYAHGSAANKQAEEYKRKEAEFKKTMDSLQFKNLSADLAQHANRSVTMQRNTTIPTSDVNSRYSSIPSIDYQKKTVETISTTTHEQQQPQNNNINPLLKHFMKLSEGGYGPEIASRASNRSKPY